MIIYLDPNNPTNYLDVIPTDQSFRYRSLMSDHNVTLYYSLTEHIEIPLGAYIVYEGNTYTLNDPANFTKNGIRKFDYTLTLNSDQYQLQKYKLRNNVPGDRRLKFSYTARPEEFLQLIVDNMNERDSGWSVGTPYIDSYEKLVTFNHNSVAEAIQMIADAFETEWEVRGKVIYLKKVEYNKTNPLPLSYGQGNGFLPGIGRLNYDNSKAVEVLFVEGGNRNINPTTYRTLRGQTESSTLPTQLLLPSNYILGYDGTYFSDDPNFNTEIGRFYQCDSYGLSIQRQDKPLQTREEDSLDLTNIYPQREGTVTSVIWVYNGTDYATWDAAVAAGGNENNIFCDFVDNTIPEDLDYSQYRIPGEVATIIFQNGNLAGREIDIEQNENALTGYNHSLRRFRLVSEPIDGQVMPNGGPEGYYPVVGNRYGVFHITLPDNYILQAEIDMFRQSITYLYENEVPRFTFQGTMDGIWSSSRWDSIRDFIVVGGYINFSDSQFQPIPSPIRITGVKDYITRPHSPEIQLSNSPVRGTLYTTIKQIETEEVIREEDVQSARNFTKRRYQQARELITLLEGAVEGFAGGINPISVQSLAVLVGAENLQFAYVASLTDHTIIPPNQIFNMNNTTQTFTAAAGTVRRMLASGGIGAGSHGDYTFYTIPAFSQTFTDPMASYYVYLQVNGITGNIVLSSTPLSYDQAPTYNLLVGIISTVVEGERSFAPLYGFTEILPGQITTDRVVSQDGQTYFDLLGNAIRLNNQTDFSTSGLTGTGDADTDVRFWINAMNDDRDNAAFRITKDGHLSAQSADIVGKIRSAESGLRFELDPIQQRWIMYDINGDEIGSWNYHPNDGSLIRLMNNDLRAVLSSDVLSYVDYTRGSETQLFAGGVQFSNGTNGVVISTISEGLLVALQGLPPSAPGGTNALWRDSNGFIRIT